MRSRRMRCAVMGLALVLLSTVSVLPAAAIGRGITSRVSVSSTGQQANGDSQVDEAPAISADGRFVAFYSYASNLVHGDTNGLSDVFVRDRLAGVTQRVSVGVA